MRRFPAANEEAARLCALDDLKLLDTPPEERFDRFTRLARSLVGADSAILSLVDGGRRWIKSCAGEPVPSAPRQGTFCDAVVTSGETLLIEDAGDPSSPNRRLGHDQSLIRFYLGHPLRGPGGERVGALAVLGHDPRRPTSGQVASLVDLARLAEVELSARRRELRLAELERLNQLQNEFVSVVSHEFRTGLTGIVGLSEMIRDEDLAAGEARQFAADINQDALRLARLVNEMLDLDRMEAGRASLRLEAVELNRVIEETAERARASSSRHRLELDLEPGLPPVRGDRDRLVQVLGNLLGNAIKYSPDGGRVGVSSRREGGCAEVCVRDEGPGIPVEFRDRIFQRYERLEAAASRQIIGTGLGLPIVSQIVEMHGGRIWLGSQAPAGAAFHFTIPLLGS